VIDRGSAGVSALITHNHWVIFFSDEYSKLN